MKTSRALLGTLSGVAVMVVAWWIYAWLGHAIEFAADEWTFIPWLVTRITLLIVVLVIGSVIFCKYVFEFVGECDE